VKNYPKNALMKAITIFGDGGTWISSSAFVDGTFSLPQTAANQSGRR
jgi:hypothetical protein